MTRQNRQNQRVAVLVDAQNIFYSIRHNYNNSRINFKRLLEMAVGDRQLIRAIAYLVETPEGDQTLFREMLAREGWEFKLKAPKIRSDGSMKADWDMGIAIDAISMAEKMDAIVLISGDGDFVDMVNLLKSRGVLVEAISVRQSTSEDLVNAVNHYQAIEIGDVLPPKERRGGSTAGNGGGRPRRRSSAARRQVQALEPRDLG